MTVIPTPAQPLVKPKLRGVSHLLAALVAGPAAYWLSQHNLSSQMQHSIILYGVCLVMLFGVSALYHVPFWQPIARARLRKLDRSMIYVFIAGTYTPVCIQLGDAIWSGFLPSVWCAALGGIALTLLAPNLPRYIRAVPYVALGWAGFLLMPAVFKTLGTTCFWLLLGGGIPYTIGTWAYARRQPNPWPLVFGYHEIFHLMVIIAAALHYGAIYVGIHQTL